MKPLNRRLWLLSQQIIKPKGEGEPGFFIDDKTKAFLAAICEAAEKQEKAIIYGESGTGKSTVCQILERAYPDNTGPIIFNLPKLQGEMMANRNPDHHLEQWLQAHAHRWVILDDFGAEGDWKSFGANINFAYRFFEYRRIRKSPTWVISNAAPTKLAERYDGPDTKRIHERLRQYRPIAADFGSLVGKSELKPYPWPKWKEPEPEQEPGVPCPPHLKQEIEAKLRRIGVDTEADIEKPGLGSQLKMQLFKNQSNEQ
jgi:energy-coupling factor transporter ATP-binding protein EcfA2